MKKMIETLFIVTFMLVGMICVTACSDKLDVQQVYEFDLATLPVQTTIVKGEEAEIRCQLVRSGEVSGHQILHQVLPTDRQRGTSHGGRYGAIAKRPVSVTGRNVQTLLQIT